MKKSFLTFILLFVMAGAFAQDYTAVKDKSSEDEIRTLFKKPSKEIQAGWFVGLNSAYTQFDKKDVWLLGISTGAILNHNWNLGLSLNGIVNSHYLEYQKIIDNQDANLVGGYGGFLVEYTVAPKSPIHVTFPLQIGAGYLGYLSDNGYHWDGNGYWYYDSETLAYDVFFFVEPGVKAEFNLLKFMRLEAGVSYRYSPNLELDCQEDDFVNQFTGSIGLKFGKF